MLDLVKHRYWYFALSLLFIVPGVIALAVWRLPLGIDFTGGSLLEVRFEQLAQPFDTAQVRAIYAQYDYPDTTIQTSGSDVVIIRSQALTEAAQRGILADLEALYGPATVVAAETVGPSVGAEIAQRAAIAVGLASLGILLYITYSFRRVEHSLRYGVAAILALVHDVLIVLGAAAVFGRFLGWEVDALFLTAVLTVVGFSVHDTIVVFDRIRENRLLYRRLDYESVVNHSIVQTLDRSINTQLTVLLTLLALALFGGDTIRPFVVALLIGVGSGTYSSLFNAAQLLIVWENREWTTWFRGRKPHKQATV
jgi:preprotein translocase subunit SecF